ncbi:MAG TPA: M24 family metallopeptidase [Nitrospiraceae bacterium]
MATSHDQRVSAIQQALCDDGSLDGWLFYDFRGSDPLAYRILLLDPTCHVTRRWYYWIPARSTPVKIVHRIEPHILDLLPGRMESHISWEQQHRLLSATLAGSRRVAMQYSPLNAVPYISRVDAGTIELVRRCEVEVISAADLVQKFEAQWTERQLESHQTAAAALRHIVDDAFGHVRERIHEGQRLTEYALQQFILSRIRDKGMVTSSAPIVASNQHSADPHYGPMAAGSAELKQEDLVLIDLWAKEAVAGSVYADITWTGFIGRRAPDKQRAVFDIVRQGRDAALTFVESHVRSGHYPLGWEVDQACRRVIDQAGYGACFLHRTGHSIGEEVHGNGANIDGLETQDTRRLIPRTCFSIEPGIYLPGEFGIRSELDVYIGEREASVFGRPLQQEIVPIL